MKNNKIIKLFSLALMLVMLVTALSGCSLLNVNLGYDGGYSSNTQEGALKEIVFSDDKKTLTYDGTVYSQISLPYDVKLADEGDTVTYSCDDYVLTVKNEIITVSYNAYGYNFAYYASEKAIASISEFQKGNSSLYRLWSVDGYKLANYDAESGDALIAASKDQEAEETISFSTLESYEHYPLYAYDSTGSVNKLIGYICRPSFSTMYFAVPEDDGLLCYTMNDKQMEDAQYSVNNLKYDSSTDEYYYNYNSNVNIKSDAWDVIFWIFFALFGVCAPGAVLVISIVKLISKKTKSRSRYYILGALALLWILTATALLLMLLLV